MPKLDELHAVILSQKPDLLCIVETWLCEDINDSELLLPGYQLYRLDRNRHGGGIMIYVCSSLSCKVLLRGGPFNLEFLAISVFVESSTIHFCKKFCICLSYCPPSSSVSIFDNLCTTLQIINPAYFSNFLLIGDFNVDFCNPNHFMYSHLIDLLCSFSLTQVVPSFTHESPRGSRTLIDLALLADVSVV